MLRVSISELKDQLSAYLKKVRAGDTVLVMDRDKPVAKLERLEAGNDDDARYQRLVAAGLVAPPQKPVRSRRIQPVDLGPQAGVLDALLEERREGR